MLLPAKINIFGISTSNNAGISKIYADIRDKSLERFLRAMDDALNWEGLW